jgi:TatD DNase family protein
VLNISIQIQATKFKKMSHSSLGANFNSRMSTSVNTKTYLHSSKRDEKSITTKKETTLIDRVLFHHTTDIKLNRHDKSLLSVIDFEKRKTLPQQTAGEYIAEYIVSKLMPTSSTDKKIIYEYTKKQENTDQKVPQCHSKPSINQKDSNSEAKSNKSSAIAKLPNSNYKNNLNESKSSPKFKSITANNERTSAPKSTFTGILHRSVSGSVKSSNKTSCEGKLRKLSVNDEHPCDQHSFYNPYKSSKLGKHLENFKGAANKTHIAPGVKPKQKDKLKETLPSTLDLVEEPSTKITANICPLIERPKKNILDQSPLRRFLYGIDFDKKKNDILKDTDKSLIKEKESVQTEIDNKQENITASEIRVELTALQEIEPQPQNSIQPHPQPSILVQQSSLDCCTYMDDPQVLPINSLTNFKNKENTTSNNLPDYNQKKFFRNKAIDWKYYSNNLIDSHCHFEMLFYRIRYEKSVSEYFKDFDCYYLKNFEACIDVICDPAKFYPKHNLDKYLDKLRHSKVFFTIGCHPHFSSNYSDKVGELIKSSLKLDKVVAIGECGLDISQKNRVSYDIQERAFKAQLVIARETKAAIVIHCRDTEEKAYNLLTKYLDSTHKIHLHCFCGSWHMAEKFLDTFPNLCLGVTGLITHNYVTNVRETIQNIPLNRILLETDSPFFVPKDFPYNIKVAHPGFVFATAESVARLKNVTVNEVLDFNRKNIKKVYSF